MFILLRVRESEREREREKDDCDTEQTLKNGRLYPSIDPS